MLDHEEPIQEISLDLRVDGFLDSSQKRSSIACTDLEMNGSLQVSEPSENTMPRGPSILRTDHSKPPGSHPRRIHLMPCQDLRVAAHGTEKLLEVGFERLCIQACTASSESKLRVLILVWRSSW